MLRFLPLAVVAAGLALAFASGLDRYLSFDALQDRRQALLAYAHAHPFQSLGAYMGLYVAVVAFSLPGALVMTMSGGLLFGPWLGGAAAVIGASTGATIMFLVARSALGGVLKRLAGRNPMIERIEAAVRRNLFFYLFLFRLIPAFPFWLVNIAAGFVAMPLRTYVLATVTGIIPSTLVYASIGASLNRLLDRGGRPSLDLLKDPQVFLPLIGLFVLFLIPLALHGWRRRAGLGASAARAPSP